MKRLLLAPLLLGLISPLALIAEEYKTCLELGKRECAIKQLVIGTCANFILENDGKPPEEIMNGSMFVYRKYGKDVGFSPNENERNPRNQTEAELKDRSSLIKARIMSLCPKEFYEYAANSYIKERNKRLKEGESYMTYDQYLEKLHLIEFLMFETRVSLYERFEAKENDK